MEQEVDGRLPFLDVLISRNDDGSVSHQVFRKKTHTEQYLSASSHHFHAQKLGVLNTPTTQALRISDEKSLDKEKAHLLNVFTNNGYSRHLVEKLSSKPTRIHWSRKTLKSKSKGFISPSSKGQLIRLLEFSGSIMFPLPLDPLTPYVTPLDW